MPAIDSCEDLLRAMVGFDTVNAAISGREAPERPLAEFLERQANELALATHRLPVARVAFNLLVTHEVSPEAPWLLFDSHLDTVSVEGMTIDPFAARIENGRMLGRGACDAKASGAAMLRALALYRTDRVQPNNVAILYTVDEEIGKTGVKTFVHDHTSTLGWTPAGVIVGEPTGLQPVVAHNGVVRWTIRTEGVSAHSAEPARGRSAISMMVRIVEAIESRYIPGLNARHPLTGKAQCSVNVIHGGTQVNIIPESCEVQIDRRVVPGENAREVLPAVDRLLDELRAKHPDLKATMETSLVDPPLDPAGHGPFIAFVQSVLADLTLSDEVTGVAYATDASTFAEVAIPAVVLGPGCISQAHTPDEWLALDQLRQAVKVYHHLMSQLMKVAP